MREKDHNAIHNLFCEFHYVDDLGVLKSKLAEYVTTARREAQAQFVNNIAAVLGADDVESFTALVMKAKQSPDLNSETRSALNSEAEIRREAREEAFREASNLVHSMSRIEARERSFDFLSGAAWMQNKAALLLAQRGVEAATTTQKGDTDAR